MKTLHIDLETFSSVDLSKSGVYKYAESPDFKVLLFGYSIDGGTVEVVDLANGSEVPSEIIDALTDDGVIKIAFNAMFERVCLSRWLSDQGVSLDPFADNHFSSEQLGLARFLNPTSWRCAMVHAAYMGLPLSLENVAKVLKLEEQKLNEGKRLIKKFCTPHGRKTQSSLFADSDWQLFIEYNRRDVETEMVVEARLTKFPMPDWVWEQYTGDQQINDCGVRLDMRFVKTAIAADERSRGKLLTKMQELTSLENPNSVTQMKEWLADNGLETDTLDKKAVTEMMKSAPAGLSEVLATRQQLAKSSVSKYKAMQKCVCVDDRVRGLFQFYGANRTGRWSGRLLQPQNLPQNHLPDIKQARDLVINGDFAALEMLYENVPSVLSELIRTAFVPKKGCKFIVADFSAIEARVIAWLADEKWRNDVFASHGKIYEASAAQMFKVPIESIVKGSPLRQKGKIAELALGYGGSVGALKAMGALEMGLNEPELKPLVDVWRESNPNIVQFWWDVDRAAKNAVRNKTEDETHGIKFSYESGMLFICLPSGRRLCYVKPKISVNQFGGDCVTYEGVGGTKKWERIESYGPKFVENIVQAVSRDVLAHALQTFRNCDIVMHIHDEIVIEADMRMSLDVVCQQMSRTPPWADGLLLCADGYECEFYKKD